MGSLKKKVYRITGHEGVEWKQSCSSTLSLTSAIDVGWWATPHLCRFKPGKENRYPLYRRLSGPQGWSKRARKLKKYWKIYIDVTFNYDFGSWNMILIPTDRNFLKHSCIKLKPHHSKSTPFI
jgi:hypothetical protein